MDLPSMCIPEKVKKEEQNQKSLSKSPSIQEILWNAQVCLKPQNIRGCEKCMSFVRFC